MTPAARLQAAIEILDQFLAGDPVERALTIWGRRSRFAGSKDRAAVRDHVFSALRCLRSHAWLGGSLTGRGLVLGGLRDQGVDPATVFTGEAYAPAALAADEVGQPLETAPDPDRLDIPEWLWPMFSASLGDKAEAAAAALRQRAPVHLRVNSRLTTVEKAQAVLSNEGIKTVPHPAASCALEVLEGARQIKNSRSYQDGFVELQDAASQAIVDHLPLQDGQRVLDYCAGGGGKSLAIAARCDVSVFAHDISVQRMQDIPVRANRARAKISIVPPQALRTAGQFDLVFCDAPCSGSGSWRRSPEGKWSLTAEKLDDLSAVQADVLQKAQSLVGAGGYLAYATCSMLDCENTDQTQRFITANPDWQLLSEKAWQVQDGTDGFYVAVLTRNEHG